GQKGSPGKIEPSIATILRGDTLRLVFVAGPENEEPQPPSEIRWSSDRRIAVVDLEGLVTGIDIGSTIVQASRNDDSAFGTINVVVARASALTPRLVTLLPGTTARFTLIVTD